ncbi:MAG TPA: DUF433 domain-containing protein [Pirellulales bacterium]|nr:DUF433 domain-containing protein [Pirellulales bacterium]
MASEIPTIPTEYAHIVRTPGTLAGEPRIAGHRIRVRDIVAARDRGGFTPEEIATSAYPGITRAQVYAALAYYEDHRDEIDLAAIEEERLADLFRSQHPNLTRDQRGVDALKCSSYAGCVR